MKKIFLFCLFLFTNQLSAEDQCNAAFASVFDTFSEKTLSSEELFKENEVKIKNQFSKISLEDQKKLCLSSMRSEKECNDIDFYKMSYLLNAQDAKKFAEETFSKKKSAISPEDFEQYLNKIHQTMRRGKDGDRDYGGWFNKSKGRPEDVSASSPWFRKKAFNEEPPEIGLKIHNPTPETSVNAEKNKAESPITGDLITKVFGIAPENWPTRRLRGGLNADVFYHYPSRDKAPEYLKTLNTQWNTVLSEVQPSKPSASVIKNLAIYYHTGSNSHLYERVNNSLFMTQVNATLKYMGLNEIGHSNLDLQAMAQNYDTFIKIFEEAVQKANPQLSLGL